MSGTHDFIFQGCTLVLKAVCKVHWSIIYRSKKSLFRCFRIWIHTTPGTASCDFRGVFLLMLVQKSFLTFGIKKRTSCQNFWTVCSTFCHCGGDFHRVDDTWTDSCHFWYEVFGVFCIKKMFFVLWSRCCRWLDVWYCFNLSDNCLISKCGRGVLYSDTKHAGLPRKRNCL